VETVNFWLEHWRWLVEMGILSLLFYGVYRLVRGTRSANVLTGLALVLGCTGLLVIQCELAVLGVFYEVIVKSLPVILVVLFQQEVRQGLAGLSLNNLFSSRRSRAEIIESIVGAADALAERRFGALIAVQRKMTHQTAVESGVTVDAAVTEELLESVFFPKTPLHDGGVWVQNDRLMAAACIFPVTQREALHRSLGLRHRAAIGLTEECDAVVVVVSEETGIISVCHEGLVERPLTADQLRQRLTDLLAERKVKP